MQEQLVGLQEELQGLQEGQGGLVTERFGARRQSGWSGCMTGTPAVGKCRQTPAARPSPQTPSTDLWVVTVTRHKDWGARRHPWGEICKEWKGLWVVSPVVTIVKLNKWFQYGLSARVSTVSSTSIELLLLLHS